MSEKNKTPKGTETTMPELNVEDVLKQNELLIKRLEELEKKQSDKPKSFEEQLRIFEYQQQIITHLQRFTDKRALLTEALAQVKEKAESGDFDTVLYRLSMSAVKGQQQKSLFEISNPVVIIKTLEAVGGEIDLKINALKSELTI